MIWVSRNPEAPLPSSAERLAQARLRRSAARVKRSPHRDSATPSADHTSPEIPFCDVDPPVAPTFREQLCNRFEITPRTVDDVLKLDVANVPQCDTARLNLLCSSGLPGAEALDEPGALTEYLNRLDVWSAWVLQQTEGQRQYFRSHRSEFENSEPYWRMLTLTSVLQLHFGVRYEERLLTFENWDWKDAQDTMLVGPLGPKRTGSCASLPVLVMAVAQRIDYPVYLVQVPAHNLSRWESHPREAHGDSLLNDHANPGYRGRFNIECHGRGMLTPDDDHYRSWPLTWPPVVVEAEHRREKPRFLRSLEPAEALAAYLIDRAHVLMEVGRYDECTIAALAAQRFAPGHPDTPWIAQAAHQAKLQAVLKPWGISEEQFFEVLKRRQQGGRDEFPWETIGQDHLRPGVPFTVPRPPNPWPDSPIADPVAASIISFFGAHQHGQLRSDAFSLADQPEAQIAIAHYEARQKGQMP